MKPVNNDILSCQLNWRYATKKFDPSRSISEGDWKSLAETLVLSPSSFGLQPWKFFNVRDPEVRRKLRAVAWDQSQITDASHLVVFAVKKNLGAADVQRLISRIAEVRGVTPESLESYKQMMLPFVNRPAEQLDAWSTRQVYIALGNFLTAAAMLGIDACPMEGFDPAKADQILGLDKQGYAAVVIATAGYRAADDKYAHAPKVRYAPGELIATI